MIIDTLIVEDDLYLCDLLKLSMGERYRVDVAHSIREAFEKIRTNSYQVVLLDYYLPDGDSLQVAQSLALLSTRPIVLFISATNELENKMAAFNAGAIDWIDKTSFAPAVLNFKIEQALKFQSKYQQIFIAEQQASKAVYTAMSDSYVWGTTARAIQDCLITSSINSFLRSLFAFMDDLDLMATIAINENQNLTMWDSPVDVATGLEQDLITLAMQKGDRVIQVGKRYFFQTHNICMLIKNIPDEEVKKGQLLDVLAAYIECVEQKLVSLNKEAIKQIYFSKVAEALDVVKARMHQFNKETNNIQTKQSWQFFEVFSQLQLTDEEEQSLTAVTDSTLMQFEEMALEHFKIVNELEHVMLEFKRQLG